MYNVKYNIMHTDMYTGSGCVKWSVISYKDDVVLSSCFYSGLL